MKKSKKRFLSLQKGDVIKTHSDTRSLKKDYNYSVVEIYHNKNIANNCVILVRKNV